MDRRTSRDWRAGDNFNRETQRAREQRPDRPALWALLLAAFVFVVAAASAHASSGGTGAGGVSSGSGDPGLTADGDTAFGSRVLRVGMEGGDVKVLNGIVKSKSYSGGVRVKDEFQRRTKRAVREFQAEAGLRRSGVVSKSTSKALTRSMDRAGTTWYGPTLYGNRTACGKVLRTTTVGVAHRSLPCGTKVTFAYHGRYVVAPVIDRGPFSRGYSFDLTNGAAKALGFKASGKLRYAVAKRGSDLRGL
ncbi:MAG: RlpA-like double-psi beta-barrel domain-containing protein [Solirubrobacterales bacterium]